ncbi:MAG: NlpC/P60 family protein [Bacteroidota bacterium]
MPIRYAALDSHRDSTRLLLLTCLGLLALTASGCAGTQHTSTAERYASPSPRVAEQPQRAADTPRRSNVAEQSMQIHTRLVDAYDAWAGTPYRWGGNGPNSFDCSGLIVRVFQDAMAIRLPRTTHQMLTEGEYVARDALRVGDLVFFKPNSKGNHAGIYLGNDTFFHASTSRGVMQSRLDEPYWQRSYHSARRVIPWTEDDAYASQQPSDQTNVRTPQRQPAAQPLPSRPTVQDRKTSKSSRRGW